VVSGEIGPAAIRQTWEAGFSGHLVKPVTKASVIAQLERAFWGHRPDGGSTGAPGSAACGRVGTPPSCGGDDDDAFETRVSRPGVGLFLAVALAAGSWAARLVGGAPAAREWARHALPGD